MTSCPECERCSRCGSVAYCKSSPSDAQRDDRLCEECS